MHSPLKGLERLTEELRLERVKCSESMQEVTRQRVEIASLTQDNDSMLAELEELNKQKAQDQSVIDQMQHDFHELMNECENLKHICSSTESENQYLSEEKNALLSENESLKDALYEREAQLSASTVKCNSIESRSAGRDELLASLKQEVQELRDSTASLKQEKLDLFEDLRQERAWNEELKLELGKHEVMNDGYAQTVNSNDGLRADLDAALSASANYLDQIRELNYQLRDKTQSEESLEAAIQQLKNEQETASQEYKDLQQNCALLNERMKAEIEACEAAKKRAEMVAQGRDFMDRQVHEMQEKHQAMLQHNSDLEKALTESKTAVSELQAEVSSLRERLTQTEAAAEQASGMHAVMLEMDALRGQLNEMRREKLRRSIEEEAGVLAPKAVIDRVEESKQVYQGVIHQLTMELETANTKLHEMGRRYEEARREAHHAQSLREEIEIYKEMARSTSQESQDAALTISEEKNRAVKATQEKSNLANQLTLARADLDSAHAQIRRLNEEIKSYQERVKEFHNARIASDKKVAEASSVNSKIETALEEMKQKFDAMSLDLDKSRRMVNEQSFTISDLRIKCSEVDGVKADCAALSAKLVRVKADAAEREKSLTLRVESLKHELAGLQRELDAARKNVSVHKSGFESSHMELSRLRAELDAAITERDRLKRTLADNEAALAEQHLFELKREVEDTAREFNEYEQEKSAKDRVIQQITTECSKEREKVTLLKLQMATLEDKLRVAQQELSVFRGIDVYHSSMQAQLQTFRKDRSFNDSALDVSAIRTSTKTERDLGSAFANSINLASSSHRPPSRTSFLDEEEEEEEDVEEYNRSPIRQPSPSLLSRSAPPGPSSSSNSDNRSSNDLMKPSSPILRPAAMSVSAPVSRGTLVAAAGAGGTKNTHSTTRPNSADRRLAHEAAHRRQQLEEIETKSIISELGSHHDPTEYSAPAHDLSYTSAAEEVKSGEREASAYDSNIFSFTRPLPRSPVNTSTLPAHDESIVVDDAAAAARRASATGVSESERQELLRRRSERKAIRDQQLREKILREGTMNSSFSAVRTSSAAAAAATTAGRDDDMSQSSAGSAASGCGRTQTHQQQQYGRISQPHRDMSFRDTPLVTAPSRRQTIGGVPASQRSSSPEVASSRLSHLAQRNTLTNANLTTAAASVSASKRGGGGGVPPYRPGVPDYARARKLLNM